MADKELSGIELSALVAERVFGEPMPAIPEECPFDINHAEPSPKGHWQHVHTYENGDVCEWEPFPYGEDIEAAMTVENRIAELGLQNDYIAHLWSVVGATRNGINFWTADNFKAFWLCIHATAEQRCRAALAAIESKQDGM